MIYLEISKKEYNKMVNDASQKSKSFKNISLAFISGGLICTFGQFLLNIYINIFQLNKTDANSAVSISIIAIAALLTAIGLYDNIAKHAGAGTLVPITGFSNSIVAPAIEFKSEGFVLGLGAKMFIIAGPVLVYGITTSVLYGFILWIYQLFCA